MIEVHPAWKRLTLSRPDPLHTEHWINWDLQVKVCAISARGIEFAPTALVERGLGRDGLVYAAAAMRHPFTFWDWHGPFRSRAWAMHVAQSLSVVT